MQQPDKHGQPSPPPPVAFVNQRLIRFNTNDGVDLDLCHALLNSAISLFCGSAVAPYLTPICRNELSPIATNDTIKG